MREAYLDGLESLENYREIKWELEDQRANLQKEWEVETKKDTEERDVKIHDNILDYLWDPSMGNEGKSRALQSVIIQCSYEKKRNEFTVFYRGVEGKC